jgi:Xaa-Pro aminopeptidase
MYEAVFAARSTAMRAIRPGAKAAEIDRLAREAFSVRGFAKEFTHAAGHGVGFSAINVNAKPRLHPKSDDTIEAGMVFNLEPAIYIDGYGGIRHCDMVAATDNGAELLTPFQCAVDELVVDGG